MSRLRRWLRRLRSLVVAVFVLWLGAFAWFAIDGLSLRPDPPGASDAIVVLTGGRLRIETGLELLTVGSGKQLFISGVNQRVDRDELLRALGAHAEGADCCVVVGHAADNTVGNARETARWMREQGYQSLRLVTSWYHMERALLEFRRAMPDTAIKATPVFALHLDPEGWWSWHGAPMVVIREYHKYLAACLLPLLDAVLPVAPSATDAVR